MKTPELIRRLPSYKNHGQQWHKADHVVGYLLSVLFVAAAWLARANLDQYLPPGFPFITFFPAVVLATFIGGVWPGVLAAVLGLVTSWYFFLPPGNSFVLNAPTAIALLFYIFVVAVDIVLMNIALTAFKESADLSQSNKLLNDHQSLLVRELDHRIKNLFAVVSSVIKLSARDAQSPQQLADDASARILALGRSHASLLRVGKNQGLGAAEVARQTLDPFLDQHRDRIRLEIGAEPLDVHLVQVLSLVLHEMATNSVKYGALGNEDGRVRVFSNDANAGPEHLQLTWEETSASLAPSQAEEQRGFGSQLIERLMAAYGGDFDRTMQAGRLVAHIRLPRGA